MTERFLPMSSTSVLPRLVGLVIMTKLSHTPGLPQTAALFVFTLGMRLACLNTKYSFTSDV